MSARMRHLSLATLLLAGWSWAFSLILGSCGGPP